MKKGILELHTIPRLARGLPAIQSVGWMPDHLYYHNNRKIEQMFVCLTLSEEPGEQQFYEDGVLTKETYPVPRVSLVYPGTVLNTIRALRHDELFFIYEPGTAPFWQGFFPGKRMPFSRNDRIDHLLEEVFENLQRLHFPGRADTIDCLVLQLLLEVRFQEWRRCESREEQIIRGIASRLTGRFQEPVDIPELVRKNGLSLRSFYRLWKQYYPKPPGAMLMDKRMLAAEHLLLTSRLRIQEIAHDCGFSSPLYFYQSFRKKHACSPVEFRKRNGA